MTRVLERVLVGIKTRPEDKWFSLYVRARDKWACQRCGKKFRPYEENGDNSHLKGLHCAHCFGRGSHATRWEEDNACALCYGCHSYIDANPDEKREFFIERLGEETYEATRRLSKELYRGWKRDAKEIGKFFKNKFEEEYKTIYEGN